jgi:hypothetical protein
VLRFAGHLPLPRIRGAIWRVHKILNLSQSVCFEVDFAGLRYRGRLNDHIDWNVFYFGNYSPQELNLFAIAAKLIGRPGGVNYFDIGANVGHHALFMSRYAARVVAFEPSRTVLMRFEANV